MKPSEIFEGEGSSLHQAYVQATSTNQEIKNQAHKEFTERFVREDGLLDKYSHDEILFFIDSLIDRTVQMTEERIVEIIRAVGHQQEDDTIWCDMDELISLITNKSDINK